MPVKMCDIYIYCSVFYHQDGVMWPSSAELFLVPCSAAQSYNEKVKFWEDVYGFDFSPMM